MVFSCGHSRAVCDGVLGVVVYALPLLANIFFGRRVQMMKDCAAKKLYEREQVEKEGV